jgi:4-alpha-glucanotransferase
MGLLLKLAQLYGMQTAYYGSDHKRNPAQAESILAILKSLGAPIVSYSDLQSAYQARREWIWRKILEPITVVWNGNLDSVNIRLPGNIHKKQCNISLILEDGIQLTEQFSLRDIPVNRLIELESATYYEKSLVLNKKLPYGYHRLQIETQGYQAETLILSAPLRAFNLGKGERTWGVFLPLYSLHSRQSWGAGNFSDLQALTDWVGNLGGRTVASLPLLATFLDKPYEPSPYLPVSKLFWDEFYIDITRVPELSLCPEAQKLITSSAFQKSIQLLKQADLVDYARLMALKRTILDKLSQNFFSTNSPRYHNFTQFIANHPELEQYARFRATMENQNITWRKWQNRLKSGNLKTGDYKDETKQYHLYSQWLAQEQLQDVTQHAFRKGVCLYLDLPLGTHLDGFDTWRYQDIFVNGISVGAPPDTVFTRGQNWTFQPMNPDRIREMGYAYIIAYLRHHLQCAKVLRIDHIMGLHRLFFIPKGLESSQGMYVRYHPEEMYAILSIESHRHHSIIVGEDLGIVPHEVRAAMNNHDIQSMWVMHYELAGNDNAALSSPKPHSVASLNTHDMPPFASFWTGQDITERKRMGIISMAVANKEKVNRTMTKQKLVAFLKKKKLIKRRNSMASVLNGCLNYLAISRAQLLLINMEDLWLETHTQNIPSTTTEHPNWRWKARFSLETFCQTPQITTILREINRLRGVKK